MTEIRQLDSADGLQYLDELANVLLDCVDGGASVNFMALLASETAEAFFEDILRKVEEGECILLWQRLWGQGWSVQSRSAQPCRPISLTERILPSLLVLRTARGQGIGARLIERAEVVSQTMGKTLLVLDTVTGGDGEELYTRLGWNKAGHPQLCAISRRHALQYDDFLETIDMI
jgi:GNAT superfamily N-acetyltransferase